jgi:hypothetical protein
MICGEPHILRAFEHVIVRNAFEKISLSACESCLALKPWDCLRRGLYLVDLVALIMIDKELTIPTVLWPIHEVFSDTEGHFKATIHSLRLQFFYFAGLNK